MPIPKIVEPSFIFDYLCSRPKMKARPYEQKGRVNKGVGRNDSKIM
jgi:hypothetical protein